MRRRPFLAAAGLAVLAVAGGAGVWRALAGDAPALSADAAAAQARAGQIAILDVRSPAEWRETGVPQEAKAVTIHDPRGMAGFVAAAKRAVGGDLTRPVATICHSGQRSTVAADALAAAGFTRVYNIREGMAGNAVDGAGWLARGLPVESCERC